MHNTLWVPGHFHLYLLLGVVAMQFGFMYYLTTAKGAMDGAIDRAAVWAYAVAGLAFAIVFLASGAISIPRRWAVHLAPWIGLDRLGAAFAALTVAAALVFVVSFLRRARTVGA
jgi:cytochrome c oxidase subunit 1